MWGARALLHRTAQQLDDHVRECGQRYKETGDKIERIDERFEQRHVEWMKAREKDIAQRQASQTKFLWLLVSCGIGIIMLIVKEAVLRGLHP